RQYRRSLDLHPAGRALSFRPPAERRDDPVPRARERPRAQRLHAAGGGVMLDTARNEKAEQVMRGLLSLWGDFASRVDTVPSIDKLNRGKFRMNDYLELLRNHRQQVVEGARWIARAASSIDEHWFELRSRFLQHAVTEHRDFKMIEQNYVAAGG